MIITSNEVIAKRQANIEMCAVNDLFDVDKNNRPWNRETGLSFSIPSLDAEDSKPRSISIHSIDNYHQLLALLSRI